jgi:hypothetical protein
MGTFAETANVDYLSSFAYQGKPNSVFHFPHAETKWKFAVSIFPLPLTNKINIKY